MLPESAMAGPTKRRAQVEKDPKQDSSKGSSSKSREATQVSVPKSIPRLDGNRDPSIKVPAIEYTRPTDLKNISEFLGIAGWYTARGVSSNVLLLCLHIHLHSLVMLSLRMIWENYVTCRTCKHTGSQ
ncbi:hypothetical protein IAQ61_010405 [Plenodomus lingam]|uniref:uncharacterized protein n=1 Tax=Leptosphaeria maculans TaxID=5022 RepID=UPI0033217CE3|nr:hypothetical protein IAQ61_010405 [Plenodomus lingam]